MLRLIFLVIFSYIFHCVISIYDPMQDHAKKKPSRLTNIQIHHNYSKVLVQQHRENHFPASEDINAQFQISQEQQEELSNFGQETDTGFGWYEQQENQLDSFGQISLASEDSFDQHQNKQEFSQITEDFGKKPTQVAPQHEHKHVSITETEQTIVQPSTFENFGQKDSNHQRHQLIPDTQLHYSSGSRTHQSRRSGTIFERIPMAKQYTSPPTRKPVRIISGKELKLKKREPEIYSKCPKSATGQFVYEFSCYQFLNCWKGRGIVQNCAPGTLFNPQTLECDYADKVECISGPRTLAFEFSKPAAGLKQASCPKGFFGIIPHYTNCTKFINCKNGVDVEMDCPPGTLFNIKTNGCDYPHKAHCVFSESKNDIGRPESTLEIYSSQNFGGQSAASAAQTVDKHGYREKLNKFDDLPSRRYIKGHYIVREHPKINDNIGQPTKPHSNIANLQQEQYHPGIENREKHNQEKSDQEVSINAAIDSSFCQGKSGLYSHPFVCSKFVNCIHGQMTIQECGPGTVFNPLVKVCDFPFNVHCSSTNENVQPKTLVNQNVDASYCKGRSGKYQHPFDCSKFVTCLNEQMQIQNCNPGMLFNHLTRMCDYEINCNCAASKLAAMQYIRQGSYARQNRFEEEVKCEEYATGLFAHPHDCSKFLNCANGRTFIQDCGPGTVYNPVIHSCDFPYNVDCEKRRSASASGHWQPVIITGINDNLDWDASASTQQGQVHQVNQGNFNQQTNNQHHDQRTQIPPKHLWSTSTRSTGVHRTTSTYRPYVQLNRTSPVHPIGQSGIYGYEYQGSLSSTSQPQQIATTHRPPYRPVTSNVNVPGWSITNNYETTFEIPTTKPTSGSYKPIQNVGGHQQNKYSASSINGGTNIALEYDQDHVHGASSNIHTVYGHAQSGQPLPSASKHWPPPFPSTDLNADYVFEDDDEPTEPPKDHKKVEKFDKRNCSRDDFKCGPNECIKPSMVCNKIVDCSNGIDEVKCAKYLEYFTYMAGNRLARLEQKKLFNVTLATCAKYCFETKMFKCRSFNYRKLDGSCFMLTTNVGLSGGLILMANYDYFELKSETINCSNKFICSDSKCIDYNKVCDGTNDCIDRRDEKNCHADKIGYTIKLSGSKQPYEGRLEVTVFGKTGYVCDDKFGMSNAEVVCRELGFDMGALEVKGNSYFAKDIKENDTLYLMDDVSCFGNETSLKDCDFNGWGLSNCLDQEIAGVICKTPQRKCPKDNWRCDTNEECIPMAFLCDGVDDCKDKSDEGVQNCEAPVELRIVNGSSKMEGRVEIRYRGTWGTICDDDFNDDAAKVVCKNLGFEGRAKVVKDGVFGPGEGPIWLDQVFCTGNESVVQDCSHWNWGEHNCEHSEDVGVICSNDTYRFPGSQRSIINVSQVQQESNNKAPPKSTQVIYPERCGLRTDAMFIDGDDVHFRVVKGTVARKGDYPWQASLRVKGKSKASHWCGAIVISQRFVLTAAHCLTGFPKGSFSVVAGDYNMVEDEGTEQEAYIEEMYAHRDFRKMNKMDNDIALIKLKGRGFVLDKHVQAICLAEKEVEYTPGMNCTISGFGSIASGKSAASNELRAGWIPVQSDAVCKMPHIYGSAVTEGMVCAGSLEEGVDACDGDSGGPLACLNNGLFTLYGITSWGQHCGYANKPGVYVKISHYRDWIDDIIREQS